MPDKKKSSEVNWKKIRAEYIRGGTTYHKLADKYGVSFSTLQDKARKEKWTDLKRKTYEKVKKKVSDSVADQEAKRAARFMSITDKILDQIEERLEDGNQIYMLASKDVESLAKAVATLKEIQGIKDALDIEEQKARIEKLRHDCKDDTKDNTVRIVIGAEAEDYSG